MIAANVSHSIILFLRFSNKKPLNETWLAGMVVRSFINLSMVNGQFCQSLVSNYQCTCAYATVCLNVQYLLLPYASFQCNARNAEYDKYTVEYEVPLPR